MIDREIEAYGGGAERRFSTGKKLVLDYPS